MDEYTLDFMYRAGFVEMPRVEYSMGGVVEGGIMFSVVKMRHSFSRSREGDNFFSCATMRQRVFMEYI